MEQDNTSNNQNASEGIAPATENPATTTQIIDTGAADDVQMTSNSELVRQTEEAVATESSTESVLDQLQREPQVPADLKDELCRDLWQLKILLQNHELDKMRELAEKGLPQTLTDRNEQLGAYPALPSEKRILELCTKLWNQREQTRTRILQTPPYDAHYNPERYREQVNFLLQSYVAEHCSNFKPSEDSASEALTSEQVEQWDPHLTKDQVLIFMQLAESLLKQVPNPGLNIKSKTDNLFKGVLLFEDFEILRCCMAICLNRELDVTNNRKEEVPAPLYYPVATCPYRLFPGETKPITKLLTAELPLKLDIEYEYDTDEKDPADNSKKLKRKIVIPYSEVSQIVDNGQHHAAYDFLIAFLKKQQADLKIEGDIRDWPHLQQMLFSVCAVRNLTDEAARQKCIQVWLQAMQQTKKNHVPQLEALVGFKTKDFLDDIFHLLKITKDEQTCEQALNLLRSCETDADKANALVGLESLDDIPEGEVHSEELAPAWIVKSFAYKLAQQLTNMTMTVTQKADASQPEQSKPTEVERSAFDVDMEDESEPKAVTQVDVGSLEVTRTFHADEEDQVIQSALLLSTRVQISAARLLMVISRIFCVHQSNRLQLTNQRFADGVFHIRKLVREVLGSESLHKHSDKIMVLKYHPLVTALLIEPSYWDVYMQTQLPAFQQLESAVVNWSEGHRSGVQVLYCDSQERNSRDTFELNQEYKGRLIKMLLAPVGTLNQSKERRDRDRDTQRTTSFPSRLIDSRILEHFRTSVLSSSDNFANEFLEDFIKVLVKALDKDPALIRKMLRDRPANATLTEEEEKKELESDPEQPWDARGMIPLLFEQIKNNVPPKYFIYNTLLDFIRTICLIDESKKFLAKEGSVTLQKVYDAKNELPKLFIQDQRIFFQVQAVSQDVFKKIAQHNPDILDTLAKHFNLTLDRIAALSNELCQAQFTYMNLQANQNHSYQRKLRQRMEQTEQFEQLYYNVSIIQGFTTSFGPQTQEMLSKLVESPDRIREVLGIFENLCLFKNLQSFNVKLSNLLRIILNDQRDQMMHRERELSPEQQQAMLEKFKVFAGRIKDLTKGFVACIGHPLDKMPTYEQIMAEPLTVQNDSEASGAPCRFQGLNRRQQIQWYVKTITEHVSRLDKQSQMGEQTRRDITLIDWEDCIQPQLLFQRIMPLKELDMFHETMLQSDEDFTGANKDLDCHSALRKKQVGQLRSALREKITDQDFKSLITKLVEKRKQVDHSFKYIQESHYERYGLHLSENHWFTKLNRMIYSSIKQVYMRQAPAQFMLETVRKNFRQQAKALALLAKNVKLALPCFTMTNVTDIGLEQLLQRLSANEVSIKPISKWAKDSLRGTLLIHFVAQDGLKALAQYHTSLQKLQEQIEEELKNNSAAFSELSERQTILVRLIANQVHDSLVLTGILLTQLIVQSSKDTKLYALIDVAEDGDPASYTSLQHFFANHYNQLLSILANWNKEDADSGDFAKLLQRDTDLSYTGQDSVLILLIREMASNFPNCPMLKDNFVQEQNMPRPGQNRHHGGFGGLFGQPGGPGQQPNQRNQGNAAAGQVEAPLRAPTSDELDMIMNMGFDIEIATSAIQMANFDVPRALDLLLGGDQGQIIEFAARQRELKEAEEKRAMEREMEMALKMSMQDEEGDQNANEEGKQEEEEAEEGKLIELPLIELQEFRDRVQRVVKQTVESLLTSVRAGKLSMKIETILSLIKVALVGQPAAAPPPQMYGHPHQQPPAQAGKALIELSEEQQVAQKTAIYSSVDDLVQVQLTEGDFSPETIDKLSACLVRFEFDIRLREMGYQQMMQLNLKITEKTEAFAFLVSLTTAVSHLATLITAVFAKSSKLPAGDIKFYEDAQMAETARQKANLVELAVKMLSVSVTTIYLIHMIVVNVSREHEKILKEVTDKDKLPEEQSKHAAAWISSTNPNKLIQALQRLRDATESGRGQAAHGGKSEVKFLADQTSECVSLVATHILSLKQWHYLEVDATGEFEWFSPEWLKTTALDFALSFIKLGKRNDKFLNQLLSLAVYEYSALPEVSQNLLNVSLLYHTVFQTSAAEKERQRNRSGEEAKKEADEVKDPNQVALEAFLESKLKSTHSKVSYKNMFGVLHALHEANPLDVPPAPATLTDTFKAACVFSSDSGAQVRHPRYAEQKQVAFKEATLEQVQKTVLLAADTLQQRFASLEATQKTRAQILSGDLPQDDLGRVVASGTDAAEEEKKDRDVSDAAVNGEEDALMQQISSSARQFATSEDANVSDANQQGNKKKAELDKQSERVEQIISQVKELASQSEVVIKITRGSGSKPEEKSDNTLRSQYNLMSKVAQFTQAYPDLTPKDDQFANWLISEWLLQVVWVEAAPAKVLLGQEEQKEESLLIIPNSNLNSDQEKVERILNRLSGLNRFQSLSQRTIRMNLRISFLEHALVGLAQAQESLFALCGATTRKPLTSADLVSIQVTRGKALICLTVLRALISQDTNAMKNRIAVIPETFQKSIYYVLLRGRPVKGNQTQPAPISFQKVVSILINLSDRFLRKQARMAAPPATTGDGPTVEVSSENGNFLHGHLINLSVGCLIDIGEFIKQHLHIRGAQKRPSKKAAEPPQGQIVAAAAAVNREAAPADMDRLQNLQNQLDDISQQAARIQDFHQAEAQLAGMVQNAIENPDQPQPSIQNLADEIGLQINLNPAGAPEVDMEEQKQQQDDAVAEAQNLAAEEQHSEVEDDEMPENDDDEDDDDDDDDEEVSQEEQMIHEQNVNVLEYDDEEADNYGPEDDDDLYGEEMMEDEEDLDDLMPEDLLHRANAGAIPNRNQRQRDIINFQRAPAEGAPGRGQPELWDIGMQDPMMQRMTAERRAAQQAAAVDETGWTQEENQIQRTLQLLHGVPLHPTAVPQGMPERDPRSHPFMRLDQEQRHNHRGGEDQNNILADDNTSIRELTEIFKPLRATEYLKSQVELSKDFTKQYRKTLDSLKSGLNEKKDAPQPNLSQTIRSETFLTTTVQAQSRYTFENQTRSRIEQLQYLVQRGPPINGEIDIEHHIADLMDQVRSIDRVMQMENEPLIFGGGRAAEQRLAPSNVADADGVGAGMQSMINQIQAEAPRRPGEGDSIMEEVMRQARSEDAGIFAAPQQPEVQDAAADVQNRERRRSVGGLVMNLDQIFRGGPGGEAAQFDLQPPGMPDIRPAQPLPPVEVQPDVEPQVVVADRQPLIAAPDAVLQPSSVQQPQLLPSNLIPNMSELVRAEPAENVVDDEQALIEQALLLSMADAGEANAHEPLAVIDEVVDLQASSSNVSMPSAQSSAANVVEGIVEEAKEVAPIVASVPEGGNQEEQKQVDTEMEGVAAAAQLPAFQNEEQEESVQADHNMQEEAMAPASEQVAPVPEPVVEQVQHEISAFQLDEEEPAAEQAASDPAVEAQPANPIEPAEDEQMVVDAQEQQPAAAEEEGKAEGEQPEPQAQVEEVKEPESFGYPNSLLIANDIEPEILGELPEEIREAVLAPLADQLASHLAAVAARAAQQNQQPAGQEEQKQGSAAAGQAQDAVNAEAAQAQPDNNGIDQDYLNALPEDVRREVMRQQQQMMPPQQPASAELDFSSVIATIDDPALRIDMLFQLPEAQIRSLPPVLRREYDEAREAQAHRIAEQERQERHRQRQAERQRDQERAAAADRFGNRGHGMPARVRREEPEGLGDHKLDQIIEHVEKCVFELQEMANYKALAKTLERQLETEDTLIETILRLVINFAEDKVAQKSDDPSKTTANQVTHEALENAQASELILLIQTLDTLRSNKQSSSQNANRNKFANAFALLLANEVTDQNQEFRNMIIEDDSGDDSANEEEAKGAGADADQAMEELGQEVVTQTQTMLIDTTEKDGGQAKADQKRQVAEGADKAQIKRSASLKLALMLIGTMRVISKSFRVDLLKGLLLEEEHFQAKGSIVIQKQADLNAKQGSQLQPPLVVILRATDSVKQNLTSLEAQLEAIAPEKKEERKEALKEVQQARALLRNLNLLILDIFKEFDQVIEKILAQQTAQAAKDSTKAVKTLAISREALVSLTQLLSLPEVEKKQLQSLGHAFLLIAQQSKANWDLIHGEFQRIGDASLDKVNDKLLQITVRFQAQKLNIKKSLSVGSGLGNIEMLTGVQADEEEKKAMASPIPTLQLRDSVQSAGKDELDIHKRQSQQQDTLTLSQDDKAELAKMIVQDKEALQVLKNTVTIYNFFQTEISLVKAEEEKKEEGKEAKTDSEETRNRAAIEAELKQFYGSHKMLEHMTLINDVLSILQGANQNELTKELKNNLSCIFESHLPDLHEIIKKSDSAAVDPNAANAKQEIKMKPILRNESSSANSKVLSLFKNLNEELPERLTHFSVFCLNNKKAINKLLQKSRAQLGLQLSDIVKYMPNLLDFESKREYFYKEIEKQRQAARNRGGRLNIRVNRNNIFQGAYQELNYRSAAELKNKIKVQFEGEAGIDASGLTREFYTELSRAMFNPDYSLFNLTSNGVSYYANSQSYINPDHTNFFKFVGRMVGKAIFDGQLLECFFARSLYKMMIGEELFFEDLSDMDHDCYRNLKWYFDNDVTDLSQYFAITRDYFGRYEEIALKEGGSNIAVNNENKAEYIELFTFHKMYLNVKEQIDAFLGGFHEIVSRDLISIFNAKELELLISGLPNFDVADLKANTQVRGYSMDSPQIVWLFEILEASDKHEQALFLQFVTGSSKIPLEGFKALQGMGGVDPFKVHRIRENDMQALPRSHTCFNTLDLPEYPTKDLMQERLLFAIKETSGFGIA